MLEHVEHGRREDIAADDRKVRGSVFLGGLLDQAADGDDIRVIGGRGNRASVQVDLLGVDLHERDDRGTGATVLIEHLDQQRVAFVNQVVAQEHSEGVVSDVRLRTQHRVPEALRFSLAHHVHLGQV